MIKRKIIERGSYNKFDIINDLPVLRENKFDILDTDDLTKSNIEWLKWWTTRFDIFEFRYNKLRDVHTEIDGYIVGRNSKDGSKWVFAYFKDL